MSMSPAGAGGPSAAGPGVGARPIRATRVTGRALVRIAYSFAKTTRGRARPPAGLARGPARRRFTRWTDAGRVFPAALSLAHIGRQVSYSAAYAAINPLEPGQRVGARGNFMRRTLYLLKGRCSSWTLSISDILVRPADGGRP